jgi:YgiT-type zinc finger domain-containing protein
VDRRQGAEKVIMQPFDKCPACGHEVVEREVEKLLRGGSHTAVLQVRAGVCLHCGERLYAPEDVRKFEEIRSKLEQGDTDSFQPLGQTFQVV